MPDLALSQILQVELSSPRRSTLAVLRDESIEHAVLGATTRRQAYCLARLYDPSVSLAYESVQLADLETTAGASVRAVEHPLDLIMIDGPRPDPRYCLQRLRALWLLAENRANEISNDPVLPFRHQAALLQFLTSENAERRVLVADEVGLGKTVEAGLFIRHLLKKMPRARILYVAPGGLVENVLAEFQRLDLPRWNFYANLPEENWRRLNATPIQALTEDTRLVVASMHKLLAEDRWAEQHSFLGPTRLDLVIIDECHMLRAYGASGEATQTWFRTTRQLLQDHLTTDGRVLFLSATPHQGHREVFLNLVALCTGASLTADEHEKARAARGKIIFRVKEHIRDWNGQRVFPSREVLPPRLAEPPRRYQEVLDHIAAHFDALAEEAGATTLARAVGFVKSQALQYAASSLRAGFAYLLRRLIKYYTHKAPSPQVLQWLKRLLPYRGSINNATELLEAWRHEFARSPALLVTESEDGELADDGGPTPMGEDVFDLLGLLEEYDALFDDPEANAKLKLLLEFVDQTPEPIVVFSQAVDTVYELEAKLREKQVEVFRLTGDMDQYARSATIARFRRSDNPHRVLVSSAAGGVGINLQVARVVVHYDLPWNPMALEQRVGRVHRIGSTRKILVETLLLRGSREAEVFDRITARLLDIVRDLTEDPEQREGYFRRILASLDQDMLRELLSGEADLGAVGAVVDAGRRAVEEADQAMQALAAITPEQRGRATMDHLVKFLKNADVGLEEIGLETYAVLTEAQDGELRQIHRGVTLYRFPDEEGDVVFDRTAASYLGRRRDQTGGLGHPQVDPLIRSAISIADDVKARSSSWVLLGDQQPALRSGDIVYFVLECVPDAGELKAPSLRAWVLAGNTYREMAAADVETFLWDAKLAASRKAGEIAMPLGFKEYLSTGQSVGRIHFPIAAIGVR